MFSYVVKEFDAVNNKDIGNNETVTIDGVDYTVNYSNTFKTGYFYDTMKIKNTPVIKDGDIEITITSDKDTVKPGETIKYTVDVTNTSDGGVANNVEIENKIPEGLEPVEEHPGGGDIEEREDGTYIV